MKCREVTDADGRDFVLTEVEEKYVRALERLEKMDSGRICMMANGKISLRINGCWYGNCFTTTSIDCEGGDGGDRW